MSYKASSQAAAGANPSRAATAGHRCRALARAVGLALALVITGCPPDNRIDVAALEKIERQRQQQAESQPVRIDESRIGLTDNQPIRVVPGDVLTLHITGLDEGYEETAVRVRVHADGKIDLPLVGPLSVEGMDLETVERAITSAYVPRYVKDLSVYAELTGKHQTTVFVAGAAGLRGLVKLPRNQRNVLYALQKAGGFGPESALRVRVIPARSSQEPVVYDLTDINDYRRALTAPPLQTGDMLIVEPADLNVVYTMGLVAKPGPIEIPPGSKLTVMRALAAAGGTTELLNPSEATLWRKLPDGRQLRVRLDLAKIRQGQQPDIVLRSGDILEVPETADTLFQRWVLDNLQIGPFGVTVVYDPLLERRSKQLSGGNGGGLYRTLFTTLGQAATQDVIGSQFLEQLQTGGN